MEFQDVVRRRRMVRNYDPRPVDPAVINRALSNATRAPSAGFSQGWGFLVLDKPADVGRFWAATTDPATTTITAVRQYTAAEWFAVTGRGRGLVAVGAVGAVRSTGNAVSNVTVTVRRTFR